MSVENIIDYLLSGKNKIDNAKSDIKSFKQIGSDTNSIKARTKDLIMQYPLLVSDAIAPESASAVQRSLEHEYAGLISLLIQDRNIETDEVTTSDYLKKFHNNMLEESFVPNKYDFMEAHKEMINEVDENLYNESSLNDFTLDTSVIKCFNEAKGNGNVDYSKEKLQLDKDKFDYQKGQDTINKKSNDEKDLRDREKLQLDKDKFDYQKGQDQKKLKADELKYQLSVNKDRREMELNKEVKITNNDIKKLNDTQPTLINGIIYYKVGDSDPMPKRISFGVKAVAHAIPSDEMALNLSLKVGNPSLIMKFIQWRTGEKKLITDLVLERNTMKSLAQNKSKSGYWFRRLEKISSSAESKKSWSLFKKFIPFGDKIGQLMNLNKRIPVPVVSLVISKSEVDQIKLQHGIDLLKDSSAIKEIMRRYYLLSFVIVDDVTQVVYFYNEVSNRFAQYSLKQIKGFAKDDMLTPEEAIKKSLMR